MATSRPGRLGPIAKLDHPDNRDAAWCAEYPSAQHGGVFDKLGLFCLSRIRGQFCFRIDEMPYDLTVNGQHQSVDADPSTPLLWVLRDHLGMTGTKFGCGVAQCGACTVQLGGVAVRSCQVPLEAVDGPVKPVEGLSPDGSHPLQLAWVELNVPQCGYCQAGFLMAAD